MRGKLLGTLIGFAFGVHFASALFNMFVSQSPQAANEEKSGFLLICLFAVSALTYFGFQCGEEP